MTPDGTLVIRNAKKKDGGVYGCLASNQAGTDTMTSILTYFGEYSNHWPLLCSCCVSVLSVFFLFYTLLFPRISCGDSSLKRNTQ